MPKTLGLTYSSIRLACNSHDCSLITSLLLCATGQQSGHAPELGERAEQHYARWVRVAGDVDPGVVDGSGRWGLLSIGIEPPGGGDLGWVRQGQPRVGSVLVAVDVAADLLSRLIKQVPLRSPCQAFLTCPNDGSMNACDSGSTKPVLSAGLAPSWSVQASGAATGRWSEEVIP